MPLRETLDSGPGEQDPAVKQLKPQTQQQVGSAVSKAVSTGVCFNACCLERAFLHLHAAELETEATYCAVRAEKRYIPACAHQAIEPLGSIVYQGGPELTQMVSGSRQQSKKEGPSDLRDSGETRPER